MLHKLYFMSLNAIYVAEASMVSNQSFCKPGSRCCISKNAQPDRIDIFEIAGTSFSRRIFLSLLLSFQRMRNKIHISLSLSEFLSFSLPLLISLFPSSVSLSKNDDLMKKSLSFIFLRKTLKLFSDPEIKIENKNIKDFYA